MPCSSSHGMMAAIASSLDLPFRSMESLAELTALPDSVNASLLMSPPETTSVIGRPNSVANS